MALNPLAYTENVVRNFLRYQLTTYPFADERLYAQMRALLSLEETRQTPLLRGPYVSLSRAFLEGARVSDLVDEGLLHALMPQLVDFPRVYAHQESAIRSITSGRTTLVSTGTGSGKTECFLYPIISECLQMRDRGVPPGVAAIIVYPMNALAEDQLGRMRSLLAGTGVPFAMYVGKTPEKQSEVAGQRLLPGSTRADYLAALKQAQAQQRSTAVHPPEERCSREEIRTPGKQPRILLTNVKQLELLLTRQTDVELFDGARLKYLVFDEAHTYSGTTGAETACLIRRLRAFCGRDADDVVCVATSATLADPNSDGQDARTFAGRFFGIDANDVELIRETYAPEMWAWPRSSAPAPASPSQTLRSVLRALDGEPDRAAVTRAAKELFGKSVSTASWESDLYSVLASNEGVFQTAEALQRPRLVPDLTADVSKRLERHVSEEEVLAWLLLGSAARKDDRPLLRPVVHGFVRGVGGAVVTFPSGSEARLWLSAEEEAASEAEGSGFARLPVLTCGTCGQHYFEHFVEDFEFAAKSPGGGVPNTEGGRYWPAQDATLGGKRVVLYDRLVSDGDDDADAHKSGVQMWMCRTCGALHSQAGEGCKACGRPDDLVALWVVRQSKDHPGYLTRCLSCASPGRSRGSSYREPARPVRAVNVADVHVLAQEMLRHAERKRLLVFADNRQDAAFQAGWMRDHARRFRLRALMAEQIGDAPLALGDLVARLERRLEDDEALSKALIHEVWEQHSKDVAPAAHQEERKYYLRIQVLREVATGIKQRVGLEPWGRIKVDYAGLNASTPFVTEWSNRIGVDPQRFCDGIASILDRIRRASLALYDGSTQLFSKYWLDGDREVQRGYFPRMDGVPKGFKLRRDPTDDEQRVAQWLSVKGDTLIRQVARKWNVPDEKLESFGEALWAWLVTTGILVPVTLRGARNKAMPHCSGTFQIDASKLSLVAHRGVWRCQRCRRAQVRPAPFDRCLAWRCDGTLVAEDERPDNYDLTLLGDSGGMVRPREHSAQVPADERERIERAFKGESETVNTLVCTPTLELGVDIGSLDTVLMRNVPPLPSNYWQRAGRAGRRHRMAVNIAYARPVSHDRAYFADPLKMLNGHVDAPAFNLRNEIMIAKHVHAAMLTRLQQLRRPTSGLTEADKAELNQALDEAFPRQIRDYLFDATGQVLAQPADVSRFGRAVERHVDDLVSYVAEAFSQGWPADSAELVEVGRLRRIVLGAGEELQSVIRTLKSRLDWARGQMSRLDVERRRKGTLDPDEDALYHRCDRLVKRYKGMGRRNRQQAEGYDDTNTFNVLAAEGFLPGYGLDTGSVLGTAQVPRSMPGVRDYELPRPSAVALREYVPGNLIYANGHRFVPRYYHLSVEQREAQGGTTVEPLMFSVDAGNQAVIEEGTAAVAAAGLGNNRLRAIPICDLDLAHQSTISDDEENRFQMPVSIFGYELGRHGVGQAYRWGTKPIHFRRSVHMRLVNVGAASKVNESKLGYPLCVVCGQSRSPFSSQAERDAFEKEHLERCGKPVQPTGFFADIVADALTIPDCDNPEQAYSLGEAVRAGAADVLDMDREDLDILVIRRPGVPLCDALLFDPMPGGSGLLEQLCNRFSAVHASALRIVEACPSVCERSCIDCLHTFRNAFFHRHLDRHAAVTSLKQLGPSLVGEHEIPARLPQATPTGDAMPVNRAESHLRNLIKRAGLPEPLWQKQIMLGPGLGSTTPDCFFAGDEGLLGICVYLDGLSSHIHGNPLTRERDMQIREHLRNTGYEVLAITAAQLNDRNAMVLHFSRLSRLLIGKDRSQQIRNQTDWFVQDA